MILNKIESQLKKSNEIFQQNKILSNESKNELQSFHDEIKIINCMDFS